VQPEAVNTSDYKYLFVFASHRSEFDGKAFIIQRWERLQYMNLTK